MAPGGALVFDGQTQRNGTKKPKRLGMGLIAFGSVFFGLAVLFLVQAQYNPDPLAKRSITSAAWWISTIEENAFRRLAVVSGDFNDIYVSPDAKLVVAVGNGGLVLRSDDGGLSWTKSVISNQAPPQNATNPRMERLRSKQSQAEARSKNLNAEIEKLNTLEGEQFKRYQELLKSAKSALKSKKGGDGKSRQLMRDAERELERSVRTAAKSRDLEDQQVRLWGQMNDRAKEIAALLASDTDIAAALAKPAAAANLRGIDFTGGIGWAVGDAGVVLKSTDGGRNWSRTGPLSADDFVAVAFTSDGTNGGIMRANDVAYRFGRDRVWRQGDEPLSYTGLRLRFRNFTVYGYGHENQVWLLSKDGLPSLVHAFSTLDLIDGKREPPQASAGQTESKSGLIALEVGQAGQKIWAVGENGKGRRTDVQENFDLSSTPPVWTDFDTGLTADLAAVRFGEDGLTGWVVGKMAHWVSQLMAVRPGERRRCRHSAKGRILAGA